MVFRVVLCIIITVTFTIAVHYPNNPTSEMSADEKNVIKGNKTDQSDESGHEIETDLEDRKFLDDAMKSVLDPNTLIIKKHDEIEHFKTKLDEFSKENMTLETFIDEMDKLSLEVCKLSQKSLWAYVTDTQSDTKKNQMIRIAAEEDEIKKAYWTILKTKYLFEDKPIEDKRLRRKLRIIRERGTNVQMPQSKEREEIDAMQRIWSRVSLCAYNETVCNTEDTLRTMSDVISIFKTSTDTKELAYYWKAYRDATGKKIRPLFKNYVTRMNKVAEAENFTDAGEMWRYAFDDDNFTLTVDRIWSDIKPLYDLLRRYVKIKLKAIYSDELKNDNNLIPAHLLGNLWAQEWQAIYPKVAAFPEVDRPTIAANASVSSKDLFDVVDDFHRSLGFESARDSYQDVQDMKTTSNCLPSSHDMCDGVTYKIKWCSENVSDVSLALSRAARLLGHVQYFKHYRHLQPLYRDGPNSAFHDAISDIVAVQLTSPQHLKALNFVKTETGREAKLNYMLWLALEKLPLMAYAYALDKWRWAVFGNDSIKNWNEFWWDLRIKETGISPPVTRNESDLDPAAKYHVVSHVQYITYLVSHVLEFQILYSLCRRGNHTGPLHECSIYGVKEAGELLSDGMVLGASEDWRTVLRTITGETELSTEGILNYFSTLRDYLIDETEKLEMHSEGDMDTSAPIIVGSIVVVLTFLMFLLYCVKKKDAASKLFSFCGLSKNGSLDIATTDISLDKTNEISIISDDKA